jgi:hypothetical protein
MWSYAGIATGGGGGGLGAGLGFDGDGLWAGLDVDGDSGEGDGGAERRWVGDGELVSLLGLSEGDGVETSVESGDGDALTAATRVGDVFVRAWDAGPQAQASTTIAPLKAAIYLTPDPSTARKVSSVRPGRLVSLERLLIRHRRSEISQCLP